MKENNYRAYIYLLITTSVWGSLYVASKVVLDVIPAFTLLFIRYLIGVSVLYVIFRHQQKKAVIPVSKIEKKDYKYVLIVGLAGYFIGIGLQLVGTHLCTASLASLVNSMNPVVIILVALPILKEHVTKHKLIAVGITVIGAAIIIGNIGEGSTIGGIIASVGSVIAWSVSSVYVRFISQKYDVLMITLYGMSIAAVCAAPVATYELWQNPLSWNLITWPVVFSVLYIGIVCTAGALLLWNKALALTSAANCSLFYPVQPLVSTLLGVILLGEKLTMNFIIGGFVVISGIFYAVVREKKETAQEIQG